MYIERQFVRSQNVPFGIPQRVAVHAHVKDAREEAKVLRLVHLLEAHRSATPVEAQLARSLGPYDLVRRQPGMSLFLQERAQR